MQSLPYVPLDPQWLAESPAWRSGDSRVVRAYIRLLTYAWNAQPAGTVPAGFRQLVEISGLDEETLGECHGDLLEGWILENGRYRFDSMFELRARISARFADAFEAMADQAAAVVQGPEHFDLVSETPSAAKKGKHRLPKSWTLSPDLKAWCGSIGFATDDDIAFVVEKFTSHYYANAALMLNWDAAFRNFALKEDRRNLPSFVRKTPNYGAPSRASRYGSAGASASAHNTSVINSALRRGAARAGACA